MDRIWDNFSTKLSKQKKTREKERDLIELMLTTLHSCQTANLGKKKNKKTDKEATKNERKRKSKRLSGKARTLFLFFNSIQRDFQKPLIATQQPGQR